MKKGYLFAALLIINLSVWAQTKTKAKQLQPKPSKQAPATPITPIHLKNLSDSASYALGENIAQSLKKDIGDLNTDLIIAGMKNIFSNKKAFFNDETATSILQSYSEKAKEEKMIATIKEGRDFLEKNKTNPLIKTTASGLQYEVLKEGSGGKPSLNDTITCHYRGTLLDGTEFDASYNRNEPLTITLGSVIKGWTEGLQLMTTGSKYKFYIPYELAYGLHGAPPVIPGGSMLIFEIELLDIKKAL